MPTPLIVFGDSKPGVRMAPVMSYSLLMIDRDYVARELLALVPVPPSFRTNDPSIPPDVTITGNIQSTCGGT